MLSASHASKALILSLLLGATSLACAANSDDGDDGATTSADLTGSIAIGATLTTTTRVNLRDGASTSDDVLLTMPAKATVTALEAAPTNGFYHVSYQDQDGWAFGTYLKTAAGSAAPVGTTTGTDTPATTDDPGAASFTGRKYSGVTMLWQGSWAYLVKCDSYSRAKGHVVFFCDENPTQSFVDDTAWVAMPSTSFSSSSCRKQARVCKGTKCIVATVIEKSETSSQWEGSNAVLKALGEDTGFSSCSRSFGTATGVTVTMQ